MLKALRGEIFLVFGAFFFAFNGIPSKLLLESGLSAWRLTEIRASGAFLILLTFVSFRFRDQLRIPKSEIPTFIVFGLIGFFSVNAFYFISIARLNVSIALIIEFTAPIWIAVYLRFFKKRSLSPLMWWGLLLGFTGLVFVAQVWKGLTLDGVGVIAAFISAFALSTYFLLGERLGKERASVVLATIGLGISSIFLAIIQPWWSYPFEYLTKSIELSGDVISSRFHGSHLPGWLLILWVVVMGTVVPYICVLTGLSKLSASTASVLGMIEPVFAGIMAWWWLQEELTMVQLLGGFIVLVGIYLADHARNQSLTKDGAHHEHI